MSLRHLRPTQIALSVAGNIILGPAACADVSYEVNDAVGDALRKNYYVHIPNPLPNPYDSMVTAIEEERRYEV